MSDKNASLELRVAEILDVATGREEGIRRVVETVSAASPAYHWSGVYLIDGEDLVLAHEVGRPTPHRRIPLDKGICGAAAREGRTIVVDDVNADPR
jgi:L-methionine (R)-S-oxide reductase